MAAHLGGINDGDDPEWKAAEDGDQYGGHQVILDRPRAQSPVNGRDRFFAILAGHGEIGVLDPAIRAVLHILFRKPKFEIGAFENILLFTGWTLFKKPDFVSRLKKAFNKNASIN
jgi:hypothetical protein